MYKKIYIFTKKIKNKSLNTNLIFLDVYICPVRNAQKNYTRSHTKIRVQNLKGNNASHYIHIFKIIYINVSFLNKERLKPRGWTYMNEEVVRRLETCFLLDYKTKMSHPIFNFFLF